MDASRGLSPYVAGMFYALATSFLLAVWIAGWVSDATSSALTHQLM
jgi:hypothetical protein